MEFRFKVGQKALVIEQVANSGKNPQLNEVVEISKHYIHEDSEVPTYYLKGYETDFDGLPQVFSESILQNYLQLIK